MGSEMCIRDRSHCLRTRDESKDVPVSPILGDSSNCRGIVRVLAEENQARVYITQTAGESCGSSCRMLKTTVRPLSFDFGLVRINGSLTTS